MSKQYDIALFGATGFTGSMTARYLLTKATEEGRTVALAGRDREKGLALIEALKKEIGHEIECGWITADINDQASLDEMTQSARALMNAAGPFMVYGPPVVDACVRNGCHYLDITGEPDFLHDTFNRLDDPAREHQVALVSACGFDSLPADLGTLFAISPMKDRSAIDVRSFFRTNAHFSGGTLRTAILALYRKAKGQKVRKPMRQGPRRRKLPLRIHFNRETGHWAVPMPVADPHVVRRSAEELPELYGPSFAYAQFFSPKNFRGLLNIVVPIGLLFFLVRIAWIRNWLLKKFPSGSGPDAESRARAWFEVKLIASSANERQEVVVSGKDPGYNETSKMFSESALCLLEQLQQGNLPFGVISPARAMGYALIDRLQKQGIRFERIS